MSAFDSAAPAANAGIAPAPALEPPAAMRIEAPIIDATFAKRVVIACGLVPALLLAWDAYRGNLGVNEVNFAIRSTGMLGLVFLSLTLVITPLRRLTGWASLISVRRNLGVFGFLYIAAHFAIFFLYDRNGSLASTLEEVLTRQYLWFGMGSLVIMIPLAITSTDGMVTRLGPRRWKLLHRLTYVAVLCGVIHFYLLVKADTGRPFVFTLVFGGLMLYRIGRHYLDLRGEVHMAKAKLASARGAAVAAKKRPFWAGELKVARIFDETPTVKTFRMVAKDGGPLPFEHVAGQYLNLALTIDGKRVNRSYTIASSPTRTHYVEISVRRDGLASKHLHANLREGDTLKVSAPAGKFVFAGHEANRIILVAGGVGITPMMSVVRSLTDRCWTGDIYVIFSIKTRDDIIFKRELDYLAERFPNLHVTIALSAEPDPAWDGPRGHISAELVRAAVPDLTRGPVMLCGPAPMMVAMRKLFVELGVPDAQVHEEAFVSRPAPTPGNDQGMPADDAAVAEAAVAEGLTVTFKRANKTADLSGGLTILEAAEDADVTIPFECRSGICGQCKTRLLSGRVTMEVQDALTAADRAKGLVLACQARPVKDVEIDA